MCSYTETALIKQIELAAKYGPELLMLLLRKSNQYDLEKVCTLPFLTS